MRGICFRLHVLHALQTHHGCNFSYFLFFMRTSAIDRKKMNKSCAGKGTHTGEGYLAVLIKGQNHHWQNKKCL